MVYSSIKGGGGYYPKEAEGSLVLLTGCCHCNDCRSASGGRSAKAQLVVTTRLSKSTPALLSSECRCGAIKENPLPLHPPTLEPERILTFGPAGSGKTTAWLDIAKWSARTASPSRFFVLDTDFAVGRMMTSYPEVALNVDVSTGYDWSDYMAFQKKVLTESRPFDWVVIDFISNAWKTVQEEFVQQIHKSDLSDYFLKVRKASGTTDKNLWTEVEINWNIVNAMYFKWLNPLLFKGQLNVFATAQADQLSSDKRPSETPEVRSALLPFGVKPKGQKELLYGFHTALLTGRDPRAGTRTITTIKDRERTEVSGQTINSFTVDYLKEIGGWTF